MAKAIVAYHFKAKYFKLCHVGVSEAAFKKTSTPAGLNAVKYCKLFV